MEKTVYFVTALLIGIFLYSCASMGRPEGGARDELPPLFVKSTPQPNSLNVTKKKIEIEFDELIQLKDQNDKVVVSPVQKEAASIRAQGRKVVIEIRDSLMPNTTYSIDFADAIQDFNEGNPIDGFSYAFATGNSMDSLQISGMLLNARDLEPQQKVLVGVHTVLDDTAFYKLPLVRISRTNDLGQFTIRNLKEGRYRLFAIKDIDRDNKFANPTEDIAFYDSIITPYAVNKITRDTMFTAEHKIDTIIDATHTSYYPNDILLNMFNEEVKSQYLVKDDRLDRKRLYIQFATKNDSLPTLEIVGMENTPKNWYKLDRSLTNDTLTYWLNDSALMARDTITIATTYLRTDSTNNLSLKTDTLNFRMKRAKPVKKNKKEAEADTLPKIEFIKFAVRSNVTQDVNLPLFFASETPLDSINQQGVHLQMKVDTVWEPAGVVKIERANDYSQLNYILKYDWDPGTSYKLTVDSTSIRDMYGLHNETLTHEFKTRDLEEYSNLTFLVNVPDSAFVELLGSDDKVVRIAPVVKGVADFQYLMPGVFYARLVLDRNGNGKFDTGNFGKHQQPEEVYYYPKKINLKKNWDVEQSWDIYAQPIDTQKPQDIKKNKPELNKWEKEKLKKEGKKGDNEDDENTEEDAFGKNIFQQQNPNDRYNKTRN